MKKFFDAAKSNADTCKSFLVSFRFVSKEVYRQKKSEKLLTSLNMAKQKAIGIS